MHTDPDEGRPVRETITLRQLLSALASVMVVGVAVITVIVLAIFAIGGAFFGFLWLCMWISGAA